MPITRGFQRELDDPNSELSKRVARENAEREVEALVSAGYDRKTANRTVEQKALAESTRAAGLTPCPCGKPATCFIYSRLMRYSSANCAEHAENAVRSFEGAGLTDTDYRIEPANQEYWLAVTAVELAS